jgi:hypothetical protein
VICSWVQCAASPPGPAAAAGPAERREAGLADEGHVEVGLREPEVALGFDGGVDAGDLQRASASSSNTPISMPL